MVSISVDIEAAGVSSRQEKLGLNTWIYKKIYNLVKTY